MSLALTLIVVSVATAVVLWGLSLFLQGYLYNEPADRLILRAAVGGLAVGCYLTLWTFVNTRADRPNKYGALHEFSPEARTEIDTFEAVHKYRKADGSSREETVKYTRRPGERRSRFVRAGDVRPFQLNSADYITSALIVSENQPSPVRFEAVLKPDGWTYDGEKKTFREQGGKRFVEGDDPGVLIAPSGGAQFVAIALNALVLAVLFVVFWPVLRFGAGHAVGLAVLFGLPIVLILMPMLFNLNKPPVVPPA